MTSAPSLGAHHSHELARQRGKVKRGELARRPEAGPHDLAPVDAELGLAVELDLVHLDDVVFVLVAVDELADTSEARRGNGDADLLTELACRGIDPGFPPLRAASGNEEMRLVRVANQQQVVVPPREHVDAV
jgi:hypothetical protein